jgi:LysM repeat protein
MTRKAGQRIDVLNSRFMRSKSFLFLIALCCASCGYSFSLTGNSEDNRQMALAIEEMRIEIGDLKHALHTRDADMRILEEKLNQSATSLKNQTGTSKSGKQGDFAFQLSAIEKKLAQIEKVQERLVVDIKQLSNLANQTSSALNQYKEKCTQLENELGVQSERLGEVSKLKSTLSSLSQAINQNAPAVSESGKKIKVKSGDSLERIAKAHHTTPRAIKELNRLSSDQITIGQELKIPDGS